MLFAVSACVPKATEKSAACGANQLFNTVTRSCYTVNELRYKPVGTKSSVLMNEEVPVKVELTYTDGNKNTATTCSVSNGSSKLEIISPALFNNNFFNEVDVYYGTVVLLSSYIPLPDFVAGDALKQDMYAAKNKLLVALNQANVISYTDTLLARANDIITLAGNHTNLASVASMLTQSLAKRTAFLNYYSQFKKNCECLLGVCSTVLIPKQNQYGAANFSYSISDLDGEGDLKAVSVSITGRSRATTTHLKPVVRSGSAIGAESPTVTPVGFSVVIPEAADTNYNAGSSSTFTYSFDGPIIGSGVSSYGQTSFGKITNCLGLSNSATNDRTCIYTPTNGDVNDASVFSKASATIGLLTYTAIADGTVGQTVSVQYFDLLTSNPSIDPPLADVSRMLPFALASLTYNESFIRVEGSAIKVFIHTGVTSSADIRDLINNDPQANRLVLVSGGTIADFPDPVVQTLLPISLSGGADGYDSFLFKANNTFANSVNTGKMIISITPTNDAPRIPAEISQVVPAVTLLEDAVGQVVTFNFRDVDSFASPFTINVVLDTLTCTSTTAPQAYVGMVTNPVLAPMVPAFVTPLTPSVPVCDGSGNCTFNVTLSKVAPAINNDFDKNICLYYTITDSSAATSNLAQAVNINITPINDIPTIAKVAPVGANINEDTSGSTTINVDSGSAYAFELDQVLSVDVTSTVPTLIPNIVCKDYTAATVAPTPTAVGQLYFNTATNTCYISTGTTSSDWALYPSLTAVPVCAYTQQAKGPPSGVPSAANLYHLDTKNNVCYKSTATAWSKAVDVTSYQIAYVPIAEQSGTATINIKLKDTGGVANGGVDEANDSFPITVDPVNDPPYFVSKFASVETNEGGAVQSDGVVLDEDKAGTADENVQNIEVTSITSDNTSVLPLSAIKFFYDENDNKVQDVGETLYVANALPSGPMQSVNNDDFKSHKLYFKLDPVDGVSGNANVTVTFQDTNVVAPMVAASSSFTFAFIVHPISALHNGWKNISSIGIKTNKNGKPVKAKLASNNRDVDVDSEIKCNYDTAGCTGGDSGTQCIKDVSPHNVVTPTIANAIYWDRSNKTCYRNTAINDKYSWVEFNTTCPISRVSGFCGGVNCILTTTPSGNVTPTAKGQFAYDKNLDSCYISTGTTINDWEVFRPSKVTLEWKPFSIYGSGSFSVVSVASYRIYRRDAGKDFDFSSTGHIGSVASNVYKYTDQTAQAGRVYYYLVRPVDSIKSFPTFTPDIYSEARVVAAPENYVFVHRWMINQEVCTSMNMTQTTTPNKIDPNRNFRCEYKGPGETSGYYDYGSDLLVDLQESGCAYSAAPKCTVNGCVGMSDPTSLAVSSTGLVDNDLFYDRNAGKCYAYSTVSSTWNEIENGAVTLVAGLVDKFNSALNAPLVNITQSRATSICATRTKPALSGIAPAALPNLKLPDKKDFNAYAATRYDLVDSQITTLEEGFSLNAYSRCNSSAASGLEVAYVNSPIPTTTFIYSLPGTFSSNIRSLVTGSIPSGINFSTESCTSRYGVQDVYGNVAEWSSDRMQCTAADKTCASSGLGSSYSTYDFGTSLFYGFDNATGPFNDSNAIVPGPDAADSHLTSWVFGDELFSAGKFSFPLGLPMNVDIESAVTVTNTDPLPYLLDIGPSSGILASKLHEDGIIVNGSTVNAGTGTGSWALGGSYLSGSSAGRFNMELIESSKSRSDVGMRCIMPLSTGVYPLDNSSQYNYSY